MKKFAQAAALWRMLLPFAGTSQDFDLGMQTYTLMEYEIALREWSPHAQQCNALAQHELGDIYNYGMGIKQACIEAMTWYRPAADQGNELAQIRHGIMYDNGKGVPKDYMTAFMWLNIFHASATVRKKSVTRLLRSCHLPTYHRRYEGQKYEWRRTIRTSTEPSRGVAIKGTEPLP